MSASRCSFYFDLISKRKKGLVASILRAVLTVLSWLYWAAISVRRLLYKKPYNPKAYTISIGNIVAGGTGKTPFAIFLANELCQRASIGILMRGYKSAVEKQGGTHVFQKKASSVLVGDEACLIAKNVPQATLFVGKNKVASAKLADAQGIKVLIVDDGMQHLALGRNFEIIMLDSQNPFGYGHLLPRGLMREPLSSLKRADLIVITCRNDIDSTSNYEELIKSYTKAPICKVSYKLLGIFDIHDAQVDIAPQTKVGLFCAIAKPDQFVTSIRRISLDPVYSHFLPDHDTFSPALLQKLAQKAKAEGATCLIATEKDIVKLSCDVPTALPIYYLKVSIDMLTPQIWQNQSFKLS